MTELNTPKHPHNKARMTSRWVAKTGVLAAVAIVLMYIEFMIPLMPSFLKLDLSEVAVLLAAFTLGPATAILIELIKNIAHLPASQSLYVGELANFIIGSLFVGTAGLIYKQNKTRKGAMIALALGTVAMTVGASVINYFFMLPFYIKVMEFPIEAIIGMTQAVGNTLVTSLKTLILYVFVPFNLFKGLVVSLIVGLLYKRLSPLLHR
ncbi:MAG: ECF transporter S component [Eubacteriales bacterium]|nr:ECF transporter S component [Eubacteriales bacterium]